MSTKWTTKKPDKEGWYWVFSKEGIELGLVVKKESLVVTDIRTYENENRDYSLDEFTHFILCPDEGDFDMPEPPKIDRNALLTGKILLGVDLNNIIG